MIPPCLSLHQPLLLSPAFVLSSQPNPSHRCSPHPLCKSTATPCAATLNPRGAALLPDVDEALLPKLAQFLCVPLHCAMQDAGTRHGSAWGGRGESTTQSWPLPHFDILYSDKRKSHSARELCPVFAAPSGFIHAPFVTFHVSRHLKCQKPSYFP